MSLTCGYEYVLAIRPLELKVERMGSGTRHVEQDKRVATDISAPQTQDMLVG
jgi:hypothetical protein